MTIKRQSVTWYMVAWLPLVTAYWVVLYLTARGTMSGAIALMVAVCTAIFPILAGPAIWYLTRHMPAPDRRPVAFAALHAALALAFTVGWTSWEWSLMLLDSRRQMASGRRLDAALAWQAVIALCLYAVLAGVSHAIRQAKRARDLAVAAERSERLRVQAELASLRAHLNPHFLFNTLHSVMALLREDAVHAELALEHLAGLFDYVLKLDRERVQLVALEEEWAFAKSYLWLEQLRMGNRLCVDERFDDEVLACAVPPFTLQPLIENAVRHGLSPKSAGGTLRLRGRERLGRVELEVTDDGLGCETTVLSSGGLGIRAVGQRLVACFGERAVSHVETRPGEGFRITVSFPAEALPVGRGPFAAAM